MVGIRGPEGGYPWVGGPQPWKGIAVCHGVRLMSGEEVAVKKVEGGEMAELVRESYEEAALRLKPKDQGAVWTVAEFGFGMNPKARLTGNVLEDEKVLGTCYFAIGDNSTLGGSAHVGIQVTGVLREPTVHLDEMLLLDGGDLAD